MATAVNRSSIDLLLRLVDSPSLNIVTSLNLAPGRSYLKIQLYQCAFAAAG